MAFACTAEYDVIPPAAMFGDFGSGSAGRCAIDDAPPIVGVAGAAGIAGVTTGGEANAAAFALASLCFALALSAFCCASASWACSPETSPGFEIFAW